MLTDTALQAPPETCWPLADDEAFALVPRTWRARTADRVERILHRHVVDAWYPVSVDREMGGFRTDLDRRWRPVGPDARMLEYQARQTRSVARLGQAFPEDVAWVDYARHGARYMAEVMRDAANGGWYWLVDRSGSRLANGTKHAHSTAYVISAFAEVYRLTGDRAALDVAQDAFEWLERVLHDAEHGGYDGWATRDGRVIRDKSEVPDWPRDVDPLGHAVGLKDMNVHSDLLESLRLLVAERPSGLANERAAELYELIARTFTLPDGRTLYVLERDLTPVPSPDFPGYALQSAHRLPPLAQLIGRSSGESLELSRRLVDSALKTGWADGRGGVFESVSDATHGRRKWWVQTESTHALTLLAVNFGDDEYRQRVDEMLNLIEREMLDHANKGWHEVPTSDWSIVDRMRVTRWPKAHRWKDSSHETDMCLSMIRMLRGLPARAPIDRAGSPTS